MDRTAEILSPRIVAIFEHPQLIVFVGCPINSLLQSLHLIDNIIPHPIHCKNDLSIQTNLLCASFKSSTRLIVPFDF